METNVKLAIIYYSSTGTNYKLAQTAKDAAESIGAQVRLLKVKETAPKEAIESNAAWSKHYEETKDVPEASLDDLEWADAYLFSVPTRYGTLPSQMKSFLDTTGGLWAQGKLANKVASAMTSASNPHGGQEQTILNLYTIMYHWGVIVAAPGYTDSVIFETGGNPYGTSVTADQDGNWKDDVAAAVTHQTKRTLQVASAIKHGMQ
ncbi:NAD(P)H dehydrogenase (quinone) [Bacillus sp. THAF10]|uniref:NAD(P)H:quinone oxidoreductase n=1 Tax=Bacillus sp. THAF10 TaxID=2587848 RepID=UPI0012691BB9|nr:NAD(P)H:quinone oxidoreductase [Bacillus sp. THAF10]QFT88129.1 NAD(P)H dehydrogenase (quinone) [Bacillus sp. THAF10]